MFLSLSLLRLYVTPNVAKSFHDADTSIL